MKKQILLSITIISTFFFGMAAMYLLISYFPLKTETIEKIINKYEVEENSITGAIERVYDTVVVIESYSDSELVGTGTGFVYKIDSEKGYIMTSAHVISSGDNVSVTFSDDKSVEAIVLGYDVFADIAVLEVPVEHVLKVVEIGSSELLKLGTTVFAIGTPMGIEYKGTVTKGVLSGKDRIINISVSGVGSNDWMVRVLQTDTAINPGNSGGPLFNLAGEVIGINSLKIVVDEVEGMGFAIPIEDAMQYVEQLEKGKKISRPYLGVGLMDTDELYSLFIYGITLHDSVEYGVVLGEIQDDSPADKAGLKKGDVITKINDKKVSNKAEFRYELYKYEADEKVKLTINRNGAIKTYDILLGDSNE